MALSKKYKEAAAKIEAGKSYAPLEAVALVKEIATANFDETVEAHFRLGIDTRQADQQLRGTVSLPNGSGKTVRVAVFAEGDAARAAEEAGADIVGSDDLVAEIQAGNINLMLQLLLLIRWLRLVVWVRFSALVVLCLTPSSALLPLTLLRQSRSSRVAA